jgi:hypothetical protein
VSRNYKLPLAQSYQNLPARSGLAFTWLRLAAELSSGKGDQQVLKKPILEDLPAGSERNDKEKKRFVRN